MFQIVFCAANYVTALQSLTLNYWWKILLCRLAKSNKNTLDVCFPKYINILQPGDNPLTHFNNIDFRLVPTTVLVNRVVATPTISWHCLIVLRIIQLQIYCIKCHPILLHVLLMARILFNYKCISACISWAYTAW